MPLSVSDASSVLPPYTPSSAVPAYSPEPSVDECIIQDRPRTKPHSFTGNYTKNFGCGTLVLTAQDEHADAPTYGRSALIDGFVSLEDRDFVSDVTLKARADRSSLLPVALTNRFNSSRPISSLEQAQ
jgi:hypothetical protein